MTSDESHPDWIRDCEAEPLAHSGAIQGHGALLHLNADALVTHASANLPTYLPYRPEQLLGQPLPAQLDQVLEPALRALAPTLGSRHDLFGIDLPGRPLLDIVLTRGSDGVLLELSTHQARQAPTAPHGVTMRTPKDQQSAIELHQAVTKTLHQLTGFQRVMVYVFREDGDGEVLAEARDPQAYGSYLGLRFPATDIPQIARLLYKKNPWRLIPDSQAPSVPLLGLNGTAPDLSHSDLRSVSPVHLSYLANMGVRASLSLPIMVGSELWGLIACHHSEPRVLPLKTLRAASQVARHYAMVISTWVAETRMRFVDGLDSTCMALRTAMQQSGGVLSAMPELAPGLFKLFDASGLAIRLGRVWAHMGNSPNSSTLEQLSEWLSASDDANLTLTDSLSRSVPQLGDVPVAGALALQSRTRDGQCLQLWLFRGELVQEVQWGGNPHKPIEFDDGKSGVAPRRSFDKWVEKRKGYSSPWTGENRLAAKRLRQLLLELYA